MVETRLDEAVRQDLSSSRLFARDTDGKVWTKNRVDQQIGMPDDICRGRVDS
jgi:hypothetical protein